jgi:hypothetical protein
MLRDFIASSIIGTPLRKPAEVTRSLIRLRQRWKSPELPKIFLEGERSRMVLRRVVTPEMNCIDVSRHVGSVLDDIVRLAPRGRHIAIEPLAFTTSTTNREDRASAG